MRALLTAGAVVYACTAAQAAGPSEPEPSAPTADDPSTTVMQPPAGQPKNFRPEVFGIRPGDPDKDPYYIDVNPEYRARLIRIAPLELNGVVAREVAWAEQRLRLDTSFGKRGVAAIHIQADLLDGAVFGDNGSFGSSPEPTSGLGIASKQANLSGLNIGLIPGGDALSVDGYGVTLRPIEPININYAYGEVILPLGVVRVGRMPITDNGTISLNDGRTGRNRWGASYFHNSVDRILFGTKISEIVGVLSEGAEYKVDRSLDDGVFLGLVYDFLVEDDVGIPGDDLTGFSVQLDFRSRDAAFLGDGFGPVRFTGTFSYRWDGRFNTDLFAIPLQLYVDWNNLKFRGEFTYVTGSTQELSAGFGALTGSPVTDQDLSFMLGRAIVDYQAGPVLLSLEYGYASGDRDPRSETTMSIGSWSRDTNLSLLMFEQTLAFQSARSAAVGIENLKQLDAESFPLTEVATGGRVTNVHAIFPQVFYEPVDGLRFKGGVLFAFTAVPALDPIQTILRSDGETIEDDAVNFNGGAPGNYWGTEIDLGVEYLFDEVFEFVLEAGVLFPGDAFEDENGDAVTSWMIESRLTFRL